MHYPYKVPREKSRRKKGNRYYFASLSRGKKNYRRNCTNISKLNVSSLKSKFKINSPISCFKDLFKTLFLYCTLLKILFFYIDSHSFFCCESTQNARKEMRTLKGVPRGLEHFFFINQTPHVIVTFCLRIKIPTYTHMVFEIDYYNQFC